ncbi:MULTISPECIES: hypothetical protein [unclassified Oleiphilus]|uniref:hypothetical protein n=1 Tax=unclassified Oleiphilus TaxID=2631174 RepID=UPI0007C290C6|nr:MULTISPECIES: hypothetical protein [unclassified Oleiphilus]KZY65613.1 hypothetical protein A3738_08295 [Oleiphilus sp. HI0066]KZY71915.1 hypothetical protein A3739_03795 [Oleiphilus sp. HI0067]
MDERDHKIIKVSAIVLAIALLFPPWEYTYQKEGMSQSVKPATHAFLFTPPKPESASPFFGVQLSYGRLVIEVLLVGVLASVYRFSARKS